MENGALDSLHNMKSEVLQWQPGVDVKNENESNARSLETSTRDYDCHERSQSDIFSRTDATSINSLDDETTLISLDVEKIERLLSQRLLNGYCLLEKACPACSVPLIKLPADLALERSRNSKFNGASRSYTNNSTTDSAGSSNKDDTPRALMNIRSHETAESSFEQPISPIPGVPFCVYCEAHVVTDEEEVEYLDDAGSVLGKKRGLIFVGAGEAKKALTESVGNSISMYQLPDDEGQRHIPVFEARELVVESDLREQHSLPSNAPTSLNEGEFSSSSINDINPFDTSVSILSPTTYTTRDNISPTGTSGHSLSNSPRMMKAFSVSLFDDFSTTNSEHTHQTDMSREDSTAFSENVRTEPNTSVDITTIGLDRSSRRVSPWNQTDSRLVKTPMKAVGSPRTDYSRKELDETRNGTSSPHSKKSVSFKTCQDSPRHFPRSEPPSPIVFMLPRLSKDHENQHRRLEPPEEQPTTPFLILSERQKEAVSKSRKQIDPEPSYSNDENEIDPIIVISSNEPCSTSRLLQQKDSQHEKEEDSKIEKSKPYQQTRNYSQHIHFVAVPSVEIHTGYDGNNFDEVSTLAHTYDDFSQADERDNKNTFVNIPSTVKSNFTIVKNDTKFDQDEQQNPKEKNHKDLSHQSNFVVSKSNMLDKFEEHNRTLEEGLNQRHAEKNTSEHSFRVKIDKLEVEDDASFEFTIPDYETRRDLATKVLGSKLMIGYSLKEELCPRCTMPMMVKENDWLSECVVCPALRRKAIRELKLARQKESLIAEMAKQQRELREKFERELKQAELQREKLEEEMIIAQQRHVLEHEFRKEQLEQRQKLEDEIRRVEEQRAKLKKEQDIAEQQLKLEHEMMEQKQRVFPQAALSPRKTSEQSSAAHHHRQLMSSYWTEGVSANMSADLAKAPTISTPKHKTINNIYNASNMVETDISRLVMESEQNQVQCVRGTDVNLNMSPKIRCSELTSLGDTTISTNMSYINQSDEVFSHLVVAGQAPKNVCKQHTSQDKDRSTKITTIQEADIVSVLPSNEWVAKDKTLPSNGNTCINSSRFEKNNTFSATDNMSSIDDNVNSSSADNNHLLTTENVNSLNANSKSVRRKLTVEEEEAKLEKEIGAALKAREKAESELRRLADEKKALDAAALLALEEEFAAKQKEADEALAQAKNALNRIKIARHKLLDGDLSGKLVDETKLVTNNIVLDYQELHRSALELQRERWSILRGEARSMMTRKIMSGWTIVPEFCRGRECDNAPLMFNGHDTHCVICSGSGKGTDGAYECTMSAQVVDASRNVQQLNDDKSCRPGSVSSSLASSAFKTMSLQELQIEFDGRRDMVSKEIRHRMTQGWTLLDLICNQCDMPLMTDTEGLNEVCMLCGVVGRLPKLSPLGKMTSASTTNKLITQPTKDVVNAKNSLSPSVKSTGISSKKSKSSTSRKSKTSMKASKKTIVESPAMEKTIQNIKDTTIPSELLESGAVTLVRKFDEAPLPKVSQTTIADKSENENTESKMLGTIVNNSIRESEFNGHDHNKSTDTVGFDSTGTKNDASQEFGELSMKESSKNLEPNTSVEIVEEQKKHSVDSINILIAPEKKTVAERLESAPTPAQELNFNILSALRARFNKQQTGNDPPAHDELPQYLKKKAIDPPNSPNYSIDQTCSIDPDDYSVTKTCSIDPDDSSICQEKFDPEANTYTQAPRFSEFTHDRSDSPGIGSTAPTITTSSERSSSSSSNVGGNVRCENDAVQIDDNNSTEVDNKSLNMKEKEGIALLNKFSFDVNDIVFDMKDGMFDVNSGILDLNEGLDDPNVHTYQNVGIFDRKESVIDHKESTIDHKESILDHKERITDHNERVIDHNKTMVVQNESKVDQNESKVDLNKSLIEKNKSMDVGKGSIVDQSESKIDRKDSIFLNEDKLDLKNGMVDLKTNVELVTTPKSNTYEDDTSHGLVLEFYDIDVSLEGNVGSSIVSVSDRISLASIPGPDVSKSGLSIQSTGNKKYCPLDNIRSSSADLETKKQESMLDESVRLKAGKGLKLRDRRSHSVSPPALRSCRGSFNSDTPFRTLNTVVPTTSTSDRSNDIQQAGNKSSQEPFVNFSEDSPSEYENENESAESNQLVDKPKTRRSWQPRISHENYKSDSSISPRQIRQSSRQRKRLMNHASRLDGTLGLQTIIPGNRAMSRRRRKKRSQNKSHHDSKSPSGLQERINHLSRVNEEYKQYMGPLRRQTTSPRSDSQRNEIMNEIKPQNVRTSVTTQKSQDENENTLEYGPDQEINSFLYEKTDSESNCVFSDVLIDDSNKDEHDATSDEKAQSDREKEEISLSYSYEDLIHHTGVDQTGKGNDCRPNDEYDDVQVNHILTLEIPKGFSVQSDENRKWTVPAGFHVSGLKVDTFAGTNRRREPSPGMSAASIPLAFPSPSSTTASYSAEIQARRLTLPPQPISQASVSLVESIESVTPSASTKTGTLGLEYRGRSRIPPLGTRCISNSFVSSLENGETDITRRPRITPETPPSTLIWSSKRTTPSSQSPQYIDEHKYDRRSGSLIDKQKSTPSDKREGITSNISNIYRPTHADHRPTALSIPLQRSFSSNTAHKVGRLIGSPGLQPMNVPLLPSRIGCSPSYRFESSNSNSSALRSGSSQQVINLQHQCVKEARRESFPRMNNEVEEIIVIGDHFEEEYEKQNMRKTGNRSSCSLYDQINVGKVNKANSRIAGECLQRRTPAESPQIINEAIIHRNNNKKNTKRINFDDVIVIGDTFEKEFEGETGETRSVGSETIDALLTRIERTKDQIEKTRDDDDRAQSQIRLRFLIENLAQAAEQMEQFDSCTP